MEKPQWTVCADPDELAERAAQFIGRVASEAIGDRGRFTLALAGGSTPAKTYARLARPSAGEVVDWTKTCLFFGDERWVAPDDEHSNFKMAHDALLKPAGIAPDHVFAVPTVRATPAEGARAYADTLERFFGLSRGEMPRFDLILLGLGDDGHTASLFPHAAALSVIDVPVTSSPSGTLPPPVERITLTYPAINAALHVAFLVAGANKQAALADVWLARAPRDVRPAVGVRPENGTLTWFVDQAAAGGMSRDDPRR